MLDNVKDKTLLLNKLMDLMIVGTREIQDCIFSYYLEEKITRKYKSFYNLLAESFITIKSFCILMRESAWSQAATILRTGIEQISAVFVLANNSNALESFANLYLEKSSFVRLSEEEQKEYAKSHGFKGKIYEYFDYGWIKDYTEDGTYGRDQILKLAFLDEFETDIKTTLNPFSHGKLSIFQFDYDNWKAMKRYGERIILICCKLFDFLCCSFYKIIGDNYFNRTPLAIPFADFKRLWHSLLS